MKVTYVYWEPWFGGHKPWFSLDGRADISFGYGGVFSADVVVAHAPSLLSRGHAAQIRKLRRSSTGSQLWLLESAESARNYPEQFEPDFRGIFDGEISYRQCADVWTPYLGPEYAKAHGAVVTGGRRELCCAFISSAVNLSQRCQYMEELMRHMEIASFGRFMNNRRIAGDSGRNSKLEAMKAFHFTLAFENAIEPDYVTEKFFEPFLAGTIPVYLGAPNVEEFAPGENCYVDASRYPDPAALAAYLRSAEPGSFHRWRHAPLRKSFLSKLDAISTSFGERFMSVVERLAADRARQALAPGAGNVP